MSTVSRHDRFVDLAALACILIGAAVWLTANARLHDISQLSWKHPGPRTESALTAADHARYLAYGGVTIVVAGFVIGVIGATRVMRRKTAVTELPS